MRHGQLSRDGRIWVGRVLRACSLWERMRGLLGVGALGPDAALLIERCGAVHTVGMRFSLDLVFLDRSWRVTRVVRNVRPGWPMVWGGWHAKRVVEAEAGCVDLTGLQPGETLVWENELNGG